MTISGGEVTWEKNLIEYYDALEFFLGGIRLSEWGVFHTHFGLVREAPPEYCFFRALFLSDLYPEQFRVMGQAAEEMQRKIFAPLRPEPGEAILDVGCGAGGTLHNLARRFPDASFHGVNLNERQLEKANRLLRDFSHTVLHRGDFNTLAFGTRFSLLYFIESAFHNPDKDLLCRRMSELLVPGGEVYIIELFLTPRSERLLARSEGESTLFHYLSVEGWREKLVSHGLEITEYEDTSPEVAEFLQYSLTEKEFREQVVERRRETADGFETSSRVKHIMHVYEGYQRLGKMLRRGYMRYGILRAKKR